MSIHPDATIHPSAVVEAGAQIGAGASVGPFSLIGPQVTLAEGVEVKSHAVVTGRTEVGEGTVIFPGAVIGEVPQDLKFKGEETRLVIGKRNRIREHVTMNLGTEGGGGVTRIGDDGLFMAGCHIAHDAQIGDRVVTMVTNDVIPYGLVQAPRGELDGLNLVGLKRKGVARADITALRAAYQMLAQGEGTFQERARRLGDETESPYVRDIVEFVLGASDRSFLTPG